MIIVESVEMKDTAIKAVREAGDYLTKQFKNVHEIRVKFPKKNAHKFRKELVSEADIESERKIINIIHNKFPEHSILTEERAEEIKGKSDYKWFIDPIDGTTNFVSHIPHFAISIGLSRNDEEVLGVIYDPIRKEMFHAEKSKGSFLNNIPIQVSKKTNLDSSIIAVGLSNNYELAAKSVESFSKLRDKVLAIRMTGCASLDLAYVACGRFNVFLNRFLKPWDLNAGSLLVNLAGGKIIDIEKRDMYSTNARAIIAGNEAMCRKVIKIIK